MAGKSRTFIWQFVIGLGFLSGLWTAIGIDPEEVILNVVGGTVDTVWPDESVHALFLFLPTILLVLSVYGAYRKGRLPGLAAVFLAYLAGLAILVSLATSLVLLLVAVALGIVTMRIRTVRNLRFR